MTTYKALVQHQTGKIPILEELPIPELKEGQLLIKVEASTVNPSDRAKLAGFYMPEPLPIVLGLEGVGRVEKAAGEGVQDWVGKRVSFLKAGPGTWGEYTVAIPHLAFPVEEDLPVETAASGVVNPLTVIGMTDIYQKFPNHKGIIHTAAASALGRMLNKRCQRLGIPLLNIVRRQEQADILRSEGALHVIITTGDWEKEYVEAIKNHGFNVLFDALAGGPVSEALIRDIGHGALTHIYGKLEQLPLNVTKEEQQAKGINVTFYHLITWYNGLTEDERKAIRQDYSGWLKGELKTTPYKTLPFSQIAEALELSVSKATEGKITLVPS